MKIAQAAGKWGLACCRNSFGASAASRIGASRLWVAGKVRGLVAGRTLGLLPAAVAPVVVAGYRLCQDDMLGRRSVGKGQVPVSGQATPCWQDGMSRLEPGERCGT